MKIYAYLWGVGNSSQINSMTKSNLVSKDIKAILSHIKGNLQYIKSFIKVSNFVLENEK